MSDLLGMLYTGASGVHAAETGTAIVGNNIANLKNKDYSRQEEVLDAKPATHVFAGSYGTGVDVKDIHRVYDDLLAERFRESNSKNVLQNEIFSNLKAATAYFDELKDNNGINDALNDYFGAWQALANTSPDDKANEDAKRADLVTKTKILTGQIKEGYTSIQRTQNQVDATLKENIRELNSLAKKVKSLNNQIVADEATGHTANTLRDARDAAVNAMSKIVNVKVNIQANGKYAVYIGSQPLVSDGLANELSSEYEESTKSYHIYWNSEGENITGTKFDINHSITGGSIGATLKTAEFTKKYMTELDNFAKTLISATNRVHAAGRGLNGLSEINGTASVDNVTSTLDTAYGALPFEVKHGSFRIVMHPADKTQPEKYVDIQVDPKTDSIQSIADKINNADVDIKAAINADNTLSIVTNPEATLSFQEDTSDFLMAAGLSGYFKGTGAQNIEISDDIAGDHSLIATGVTGKPGDNTNAMKIAELQYNDVKLPQDKTTTISKFYQDFVGDISSDEYDADNSAKSAKQAFEAISQQKMAMTGVNANEESINLKQWETIYSANSRYINTVNEMLDTLMKML